jgi:F-type H+-transporting ATPase subunit c
VSYLIYILLSYKSTIQAVKILGTGLATTGLIGAGVEIGVVFGALILGVARNPSLRGQLFSYAILGFAFATGLLILLLNVLTTNYSKIENCCDTSLFPHIVLAGGKSKATPEEIEEKQKKLNDLLKEDAENMEERKKVDEENTRDGDTDSPYEEKSAEELEH